jgi:hypothetical protein
VGKTGEGKRGVGFDGLDGSPGRAFQSVLRFPKQISWVREMAKGRNSRNAYKDFGKIRQDWVAGDIKWVDAC